MVTGWVWHERYAWHDTRTSRGDWLEPVVPLEDGATKRRLRNLVEAGGLLGQLAGLTARPATDAELLAVHTPGHLERLAALDAAAGADGGDGGTPMRPGSLAIARLAAGGAVEAAAAVLDGRVRNAYALVRPPGHHAEPDRAMGYCLLNNVAIAARAAQAAGVERVAIVDWDVHHGNGTQACFAGDDSVLTISLHQDGWYPVGSGAIDELPATEANINVPLPAGSGIGAYLYAMDRVVIPAVERFSPGLILVACGLDAGAMDPLGRQLLSSDDFRALTRAILDLAAGVCDGRAVFVHEGGYSPQATPFYGLAVVETLAGVRTAVTDPYLTAPRPGTELSEQQAAAVEAVAAR